MGRQFDWRWFRTGYAATVYGFNRITIGCQIAQVCVFVRKIGSRINIGSVSFQQIGWCIFYDCPRKRYVVLGYAAGEVFGSREQCFAAFFVGGRPHRTIFVDCVHDKTVCRSAGKINCIRQFRRFRMKYVVQVNTIRLGSWNTGPVEIEKPLPWFNSELRCCYWVICRYT